jgi:hypothetical protein
VSPVKYEPGFYIPEDDIVHSHRRENLKSYITLTGCALQRRSNVSPVRYELGFYIPKDAILDSHRRRPLKPCTPYTFCKPVTLTHDLSVAAVGTLHHQFCYGLTSGTFPTEPVSVFMLTWARAKEPNRVGICPQLLASRTPDAGRSASTPLCGPLHILSK